MENNIKITEELLNQIIDRESKKYVGIILRRYEIIADRETLKKETKELIYEAYRNIRDILLTCKEAIRLKNAEMKGEEKNGRD